MSGAIIPAAQRLRIAANALPVPALSPLERTATEFAIEGHCRNLADQRLLTEALGLDTEPGRDPGLVPGEVHGGRAVAHGYHGGRAPRRRRG